MHVFSRLQRASAQIFLFALATSSTWSARAQIAPASTTALEPVVVLGRATDLIGTAEAASQGSIGYVELNARPFLRRGELLEVIPGVVLTQHSGGGKANQYFLRGFNLDHGTDFSVSVDGMPVNMRSHAHGQGYADLNFIIPEFVQSVEYNKGPYAAEVGDFSAAGAARFELFKTLPKKFATVEIGENSYARFVAGQNVRGANGSSTMLGFEATHDDGPWLLDEKLRRYSLIARHTWRDRKDQELSITALGFRAQWNSTDQVPRRAVESGVLDRFGTVDPSDGGETERASLSFDWTIKGADSVSRINAYAIYYRLDLYSNFTYFLEDPVNGDQFNQRDRRGVFGVNAEHRRTFDWSGIKTEATFGVQLRDDVVDELGLTRTTRRGLLDVTRVDDVREISGGVFAKATTRWNEWARTELGLRGDAYHFDVDSDNPLNSGVRTESIASPKLGVVLGPWRRTEVYFNAGSGFHSNDARGTTIRVEPVDGTTPAERVNPLVRSRGIETGIRTSFAPGLVSTVALWSLDLDSELVFVGDAGGTEASGRTRRHGVEFANFYRASPWLTLDADVSFTHARYRDGAPANHVANSIDTVVTAGVTMGRAEGFFGSVRLRYFGGQPLVEDNSVRQPSSATMNARMGWRNREWEIALTMLNALDESNDDIAYFYTSRLQGEPLAGVEDIHFHPAEPRTVRISVSRHF